MSYKPSVLVVDDESGILDTLRSLLRNEGFEVSTAQVVLGWPRRLSAAARLGEPCEFTTAAHPCQPLNCTPKKDACG